MTWDNSKYIKLLLDRPAKGQDSWLIALRTTADYYGWTKQFPEWSLKIIATEGKYSFSMDPGRKGEMFCESGRKHRVCRSPSRDGNPAGMTNQFKVSRNTGLLQMAELAHFTEGDWHWMEGPRGERVSKDRWEARYQATK